MIETSRHSREGGNQVPVPPSEQNGREIDPGLRGGDGKRVGVASRALILIAKGWQKGPSAILPPSCRFQPSCSAYAITAWTRYGAGKGSWLALKRIFRCHPWGGQGHDPVP